MQSFTDISIMNLHGNSKKKEKCPDGSKDENVFDIQQGVAVGILVKEFQKKAEATVHYADLWGLREAKSDLLYELDIKETEWGDVRPQTPNYFFIPQETKLLTEYEKGWKLTEIFPVNSVGVVTARDHFTIRWSREEVWQTIQDFRNISEEEARGKYALRADVRDWKVRLAQEDIRSSGPKRRGIVPLLYRPFDVRYTYYTGRSRGYICMPRPEVMQHMFEGNNVGLITVRKAPPGSLCNYFLASRHIISNGAIRSDNQSIDTFFPLYLKTVSEAKTHGQAPLKLTPSRSKISSKSRRVNLRLEFVHDLETRLRLKFDPDGSSDAKTIGPDDVFYYVYAVFYSASYRERYAQFLKIDFPRVPLTSDSDLFAGLVEKGANLVSLHLMESPKLAQFITRYEQPGEHLIENVRYAEPSPSAGIKSGRVYINKTQYFEGVPKEVWEFHIGGYQVCEKWLKDRKGRKLSSHDIDHYQKIIVALKETIRLMQEIDEIIPGWPLP